MPLLGYMNNFNDRNFHLIGVSSSEEIVSAAYKHHTQTRSAARSTLGGTPGLDYGLCTR